MKHFIIIVLMANWKVYDQEIGSSDRENFTIWKRISLSRLMYRRGILVVNHLEEYLEAMMEDIGDTEYFGPNVRPCGKVNNPRTLLPRPGLKGDVPHFPVNTWPERPDAPQRPTPEDAYAGSGPWSKIGNNWMICPVCLFAAPMEEFVEAIAIHGDSVSMNQ